jgi:ABC-type branched-subunit amino acid transport system permease subunit
LERRVRRHRRRLIAIGTAYVNPDVYSLALSTTLLIGLVLGGLETMWGALVGGVIVEFLPLWAQKINSGAPGVVQGVALILVMLLMPGGIAGTLMRAFRRPRAADAAASPSLAVEGAPIAMPAATSRD